MKRNKEETTETINKIIDVARSYFTKHGYADSTLEDIANEAELTRGSIYHHFRNKKGLFHVVLESVQKEVAERIETEAAKSDDVWEQLLLGCRAFVAAAVEPQNKRVMLIDGPAVLGWETWRMMDEHNSMRLLRGQLQMMEQQGCLKPVSVDAMTHCLSGSLNESALWIAQMPDYQQSLEATMRVISHMLTGFKSETVIEE
ncbi:TetR/AcrR family transcriptional regulator [Paenibacillus radicis (ex Xue et al. 2023)]|uniref:TetR/AcrR family transcriptional regulator n=1 Tax=Paenibacillus radicis (ex Xue et al. 2023) TaxID=2972489 RepID=A0ABT1YDS4_9BACL|nr:TetR/AcrR family transcriptional regulator [Paenibacillus radicis (ex Xue et al. 2023)]MCR8631342.1 TetR/AcrR family transcriptional regulator [Paenibacillus radicis (ex Xue et al. 2023)]